jgi:hypothetical protein
MLRLLLSSRLKIDQQAIILIPFVVIGHNALIVIGAEIANNL